MEKIKDLLESNHTVSVIKGSCVWKKGQRKCDMKSKSVIEWLRNVSIQRKDFNLVEQIVSKKQEITDFIEQWVRDEETRVSNDSTETEFNINEFIMNQFDRLFRFDEELMTITMKNTIGNSFYNSTKAAEIILSRSEAELNNLPKGLSIERVRRTLATNITRIRESNRCDKLSRINFIKEDDTYVTQWVNDLFRLYNIDRTKLNIIMFKQLLYSIKRAVFGLTPPDCRYMYTFFNRKQAAGKSRFVKHLCDPFQFLFTDQGTLDMLVNKNDLKALTAEKMVIDIQELASDGEFNHSSYAAMKAAITSDSVGGRVLYSVDSESQPMLSVFVSSTNIHIADMIRDDTGLRRFYSFDFHNMRSNMDWDLVDKHWSNIETIYTMINENSQAPLTDKMEIFAELEKVQEEYKRKSDFIIEWQTMTGNKLVKKTDLNAQVITKLDLFTLISGYCKQYEGFNLKIGTLKNLLISRHSIYPQVDETGCDYYYIVKNQVAEQSIETFIAEFKDTYKLDAKSDSSKWLRGETFRDLVKKHNIDYKTQLKGKYPDINYVKVNEEWFIKCWVPKTATQQTQEEINEFELEIANGTY